MWFFRIFFDCFFYYSKQFSNIYSLYTRLIRKVGWGSNELMTHSRVDFWALTVHCKSWLTDSRHSARRSCCRNTCRYERRAPGTVPCICSWGRYASGDSFGSSRRFRPVPSGCAKRRTCVPLQTRRPRPSDRLPWTQVIQSGPKLACCSVHCTAGPWCVRQYILLTYVLDFGYNNFYRFSNIVFCTFF